MRVNALSCVPSLPVFSVYLIANPRLLTYYLQCILSYQARVSCYETQERSRREGAHRRQHHRYRLRLVPSKYLLIERFAHQSVCPQSLVSDQEQERLTVSP